MGPGYVSTGTGRIEIGIKPIKKNAKIETVQGNNPEAERKYRYQNTEE